VLRHMWDRSKLFLRRAGTVILGINIILWFLATYPKSQSIDRKFNDQRAQLAEKYSWLKSSGVSLEAFTNGVAEFQVAQNKLQQEEAGEKLRNSFAGKIGHAIEPMIAPLNFDWRMGIGIVASFAAREVFVSTMSTVYNVGQRDESEESKRNLTRTLQEQKREDGRTPVYTALTGLTLMVFYVFALQCVSTVAVVRRETNSWKWPLFQWIYMGILAWGFAFATLHLGRLMGLH